MKATEAATEQAALNKRINAWAAYDSYLNTKQPTATEAARLRYIAEQAQTEWAIADRINAPKLTTASPTAYVV